MALWISAAFFAAFLANVLAGAFMAQPFVGDIFEMLLLCGAAVAFAAETLRCEAARNARKPD